MQVRQALVDFSCDDAMEVELDFSIAHPAYPFDQTSRFVVLLALLDDILELCPWLDAKRRLIDGLISRIEFRNDEVARSTKG